MPENTALTIGPSADAVRAAGKELCDLIAVLSANHCCEEVQLGAIKAFRHICEVRDVTVQHCKFYIGDDKPKAAEPPVPVDHGTGNY